MDVDRVQRCAEISIRRGLSFALLAVACLMVAFSFNLSLAMQTGAATTLMICVVLFFRSLEAPTRDYRKTETWLLLDKQASLPPERLQTTIGGALQRLYRHYAKVMLGTSTAFWLVSVVTRLI